MNSFPPLVLKKMTIDELKARIEQVITSLFSFDFEKKRQSSPNILDTVEDLINREKILKQRQIDMIQGELWQKVFGCVDGITDLGKGHWSGLDLYCQQKKQYFEIKKSHRTDNSSSRKFKEQLLCRVKKQHPDHI